MSRRTRAALFGAVVTACVLVSGSIAFAEEPFTITPGDSVGGLLWGPDTRHCIHLELPAHATLKATLRRDTGEDFAVRLDMRTPNGALFDPEAWVKAKRDGRKLKLRDFVVPESGVWRLIPRTGDFRGGRYTLTTSVEYRSKFKDEGVVTAEAQEVVFPFSGPAGGVAKVRLKGRDGCLPQVLEIRDPNGVPIDLPEPVGTGKKVKLYDVALPSTGDYTLIAAARDGTTGRISSKIKVRGPDHPKVAREWDGPLDCCQSDEEPPPDPDHFTISTELLSPVGQTLAVGSTEVRALTMSIFTTQPTTVRWLRLRSYGDDDDILAVRMYWDNDRFYSDDDPGTQIAGGWVKFVDGKLDLEVDLPLGQYASRYLHVVLDLRPGLAVGTETGVRVPSGGVEISDGLWNPGSRPPHDPGPIEVVVPEVTFSWQDVSQIAGDKGPEGEGHLMVRAGRKLILFPANETPFRNYYELDLDFLGAGWRLVAAGGGLPPKRWGACGVYDPQGNRLVMFGGQNGTGTASFLNDVWELNLDETPPEWTDLTGAAGTAPAARMFASAVYDSSRRRMVVFGGHLADSTVQPDTWLFDLATDRWSGPLTVAGTVPFGGQGLTGHVAIYDPVHDRMVVHGGSSVAASANEFTSTSTRTYVLEFTGISGDNVWRSVVKQTTEAPSGRMNAVAAFDGARMIIHGGARKRLATTGATDLLADTWVLDLTKTLAGKWTRLHFTDPNLPTARAGHQAAWDPKTRAIVFYGGLDEDGDLEDTWLLREEED